MTIVTLPGLDGTGYLYAPFVASTPPGYVVHPIDYPRHEPQSVAELEALVRRQVPTGPFVLLAESFSGLVAIRLAADPPANLRGLILVATAARWSRTAPFRIARVTPLFAVPPPAAIVRYFALGRDSTDEQVAIVQIAVAAVRPKVLAARFLELARADLRTELATVGLPTLYIQGVQDRLARRKERDSVTVTLPSARCATIDGPHCLLFTRPAAVWDQVRVFSPSLCAG
jgi:pimeloyl-[acyl-carrier protein] methyl ester esterase